MSRDDDDYSPLDNSHQVNADAELASSVGMREGMKTAAICAAVPYGLIAGTKYLAPPLYVKTLGRINWQASLIIISCISCFFGYSKAQLTTNNIQKHLAQQRLAKLKK
eukprot:TRINITY_DN12792_c0_g1_i2.p1 TRINITY_DN12792_c0_g1~~TRINITY_DN12792_c0_g1_i2.p1  ORF type:complete len:108 (-),score=11.46 TRINITY_DN12792_c0_g1_i2:223-546(-)